MDRLDSTAIVIPGVEVRVVQRCGSTNSVLLAEPSGDCVLLAAEEQTAGRGRRGHRWHIAAGAGITFSICRRVKRPVRELAGLSLVAGVALARTLRALGARKAALKWPNDLVVEGAKLGGILVETRAAGASARAVIGIGLNCRHDPALAPRVKRPVTSLDQYIEVPHRNALITKIAAALVESLNEFDALGLDSARTEWERMHAHAGQRLRVRLSDGRIRTGIASGLAQDGALRLQNRNGVTAVRSGRIVSARPA